MRNEFIISIVLILLAVTLQTTLFRYIAILGIRPDLSLIMLIFIAYRRGGMTGQISGFAAGLFEDLVSISPPGFNALIKTIIGNLFGVIQGKMFIDPIIMPFTLILTATIVKLILFHIFGLIFGIGNIIHPLIDRASLVEILYNSFLAPFVFAVLSPIKALKLKEKEYL